MKEVFEIPTLTVVVSIDSIVRNVPTIRFESVSVAKEGTIELERTNDDVCWRQGSKSIIFPISSVVKLEIIPVQNAGQEFVALALTFTTESESLRYRMITSHISDAVWLKNVSTKVAHVLGIPVSSSTVGWAESSKPNN